MQTYMQAYDQILGINSWKKFGYGQVKVHVKHGIPSCTCSMCKTRDMVRFQVVLCVKLRI